MTSQPACLHVGFFATIFEIAVQLSNLEILVIEYSFYQINFDISPT
jgi:hypothetical protein